MSYDMFQHDVFPNLLPYNGEVVYYGKIFPTQTATHLLQTLLETVPFKNDTVMSGGKSIETSRKVAWFGDKNYTYTYSGTSKQSIRWSSELSEIRHKVEHLCNETFNSCLVNLYHSGKEGVSWHSDNEHNLKKEATIASVTFGAPRNFVFKHKETKQSVSVILEHGSLLLMRKNTQQYWLHSLPKTTKVKSPRVNLTFRTFLAG